jgi:hypothetical protein
VKGDFLRGQLMANGGNAGAKYLAYIVSPEIRSQLPDWLQSMAKSIRDKHHFADRHRFWVRTLTAAAVAAIIVDKLKLVNFSPSRIIEWATRQVVNENLPKTQGDVALKGHEVVSLLGEYLNEHVQDVLWVQGRTAHGLQQQQVVLKPPRQLLIRYEEAGQTWVLSRRPLVKWLNDHRVSPSYVFDMLKKHEVLKRDGGMRTLSAGTDLRTGQVIAVELDGGHPLMSGMLRVVERWARTEAGKEAKG